jgi:hypothetical protein
MSRKTVMPARPRASATFASAHVLRPKRSKLRGVRLQTPFETLDERTVRWDQRSIRPIQLLLVGFKINSGIENRSGMRHQRSYLPESIVTVSRLGVSQLANSKAFNGVEHTTIHDQTVCS